MYHGILPQVPAVIKGILDLNLLLLLLLLLFLFLLAASG